MREALVASALESAQRARRARACRAIASCSSCKVSGVQDLIAIYRDLARALRLSAAPRPHRGGHGLEGHRRLDRRRWRVLLQEGIGDTIRVSLTPEPGGDRTQEVIVAQEILQTMGLRSFTPMVIACPGCGRTTSTFFQELADKIQTYLRDQMPDWRAQLSGRRGHARRGDGLRGERPGRKQARQHRHQPARHRASARWRRSTSTARRP